MTLRHPKTKERKQTISALISHWEALKQTVTVRGKVLEDNRDFLEFFEVWIRQKELLKKLSEFRDSGSGVSLVFDLV